VRLPSGEGLSAMRGWHSMKRLVLLLLLCVAFAAPALAATVEEGW